MEKSQAQDGLRVLVVDDNELAREMIGRVLLRGGHSSIFAKAPGEALGLVFIETIDVAIVDASLPEMSGYELWERISAGDQELGASTLIVSGEFSGEELAREEEGPLLLSKPFRASMLLRAVECAWARRRRVAGSAA